MSRFRATVTSLLIFASGLGCGAPHPSTTTAVARPKSCRWVTFPHVFSFTCESADLNEALYGPSLDDIVQRLHDRMVDRIRLSGTTANVESSSDIGYWRALAVAMALFRRGIPSSMVEIEDNGAGSVCAEEPYPCNLAPDQLLPSARVTPAVRVCGGWTPPPPN